MGEVLTLSKLANRSGSLRALWWGEDGAKGSATPSLAGCEEEEEEKSPEPAGRKGLLGKESDDSVLLVLDLLPTHTHTHTHKYRIIQRTPGARQLYKPVSI